MCKGYFRTSPYPNLYIEVSATFQYMHLLDRENIRDFFIEYQDRILYGTDWGRSDPIDSIISRYVNTFIYFETDRNVFGTQGLDLPREVLEKIYYKNAVKLIPGLREAMGL